MPRYGDSPDSSVVLVAVPDYGGRYLAGDDGRIYSMLNGRHGLSDKPRRLLSAMNKNGYFYVAISTGDGKRTSNKQVHRLVCAAFHGKPPSSKHEVRHLDGRRDNNVPSNLQWGTRTENCRDTIRHGRSLRATGVVSTRIGLAIKLIGDLVPNVVLSEWFGVDDSRICAIKTGREWAWISDEVMKVIDDALLRNAP